jgi:uncharacterized membrane protein
MAAAAPHGDNLPRAPLLAATVGGRLAAVGHGSCLANRRGARRLVAKSAKISNGRIIFPYIVIVWDVTSYAFFTNKILSRVAILSW